MGERRADYQTHWYPETYLETILDRESHPRAERREDGGYALELRPDGWVFPMPRYFVDLEVQLEAFDRMGVSVVVSTPSIVGEVGGLDLGEAKETVALLNEESARAQSRHPDRFIGTAMLPVQDLDASIEALDHAVGLGLTAVCLLSNSAGRPIATEETLPLYRHIERLGLPIILHPANYTLAANSGVDLPTEVGLGWMYDTAAAALSLISSGTLDACPALQIVHPHVGGVIPFIEGRLEIVMPLWGHRELANSPRHYLRNHFFVDSVSQVPGALRMAIDCYGLDRVLFASDYPWSPVEVPRRYVEESAGIEDARAILFDNQMPFVQRVLDRHPS